MATTPGMARAIMRERGRHLREQAIVQAFDIVRIKADAMNGNGRSLGDYLDDLLSDDERLDKSSAALAAYFDNLSAREDARSASEGTE